MTQSHTPFKIILFILIISLCGCAKYKMKRNLNKFESAITSYGVAMRWAQYLDAYNYHVSPDGSQPPADLEKLQELSVTGIKVVDKAMDETQTEAVVKTEISYYFKDQGSIKTIKLEQRWWLNEKTKQWLIDSAFPQF